LRKSTLSLDHLIGAGEERGWNAKPKRLSGLQIDHQLELRGLLDRQISWVRASEDEVDVDAARRKTSTASMP